MKLSQNSKYFINFFNIWFSATFYEKLLADNGSNGYLVGKGLTVADLDLYHSK